MPDLSSIHSCSFKETTGDRVPAIKGYGAAPLGASDVSSRPGHLSERAFRGLEAISLRVDGVSGKGKFPQEPMQWFCWTVEELAVTNCVNHFTTGSHPADTDQGRGVEASIASRYPWRLPRGTGTTTDHSTNQAQDLWQEIDPDLVDMLKAETEG
jgi:hypothetical protein